MPGVARFDDAVSLRLTCVIAEVITVAAVLTLGVRVGALALSRRQLTDRIAT